LNEVREYLSKYKNIEFYPGFFPKSAETLNKDGLKFSFVHLDTDIYEATLEGLKFFYPLMTSKGVFIIHDYRSKHLPGVKKAVNDFFANKQETIIELWDTQALIIKN
jgi:O-methyltransferase